MMMRVFSKTWDLAHAAVRNFFFHLDGVFDIGKFDDVVTKFSKMKFRGLLESEMHSLQYLKQALCVKQ